MNTEVEKFADYLIEWITSKHDIELDRLTEFNIVRVIVDCIEMLLDLYQQGRADAIDEFVEKICEKYTEEESKGNYKQYCGGIKQNIADIAEQLKAKE